MRIALIFGMFLMGAGFSPAQQDRSSKLEVLVDGISIPRYYHQGSIYIEAIKGKEYSLRISNPLGERIAVALSVDGLNTINAQHTEARVGPKWVLGPYESVTISGWQINSSEARRFFFTTEDKSYGAWLGRTKNLGVIGAAFFRERPQPVTEVVPAAPVPLGSAPTQMRKDAAAADHRSRVESRTYQPEYAATGIGDRVTHAVERVYLDLEDRPFATIDLRYEFRPVLVRLGVLPHRISEDPLARRERAKGFREDSFCPEP